jgi:plasmid stability protein
MLASNMPTLTIRNVPPKVVKSLKSLARRNRRSMEHEVRALLEEHVGDREALLEQIERAWSSQTRKPKASEVEHWLRVGRE